MLIRRVTGHRGRIVVHLCLRYATERAAQQLSPTEEQPMIGQQPTGALPGIVITAMAHEGLTQSAIRTKIGKGV